jgi:predicted Fe-Mo cluster-binding NifX family protein
MGNKTIKIAVPTDDGEVIVQQCRCSLGFIVATVKSGKIVNKELRWNLLSEILTSEEGLFYNLCDCDVVILNQISERHRTTLNDKKKKIVLMEETDVSKAFVNFLERNNEQVVMLKKDMKTIPVI